jgi:hypothetical protein
VNNKVENLRYVSRGENGKNKSSFNGITYEYIKELPSDAIVVDEYGKHKFEDLYYYNANFFFFNGISYRKLTLSLSREGYYGVRVRDINNKDVMLYLAKYRRIIGEVD